MEVAVRPASARAGIGAPRAERALRTARRAPAPPDIAGRAGANEALVRDHVAATAAHVPRDPDDGRRGAYHEHRRPERAPRAPAMVVAGLATGGPGVFTT